MLCCKLTIYLFIAHLFVYFLYIRALVAQPQEAPLARIPSMVLANQVSLLPSRLGFRNANQANQRWLLTDALSNILLMWGCAGRESWFLTRLRPVMRSWLLTLLTFGKSLTDRSGRMKCCNDFRGFIYYLFICLFIHLFIVCRTIWAELRASNAFWNLFHVNYCWIDYIGLPSWGINE